MRSVRIATWTSGLPVSLAAGVVLDDFLLLFGGNRHSSYSATSGRLNPRTTLASRPKAPSARPEYLAQPSPDRARRMLGHVRTEPGPVGPPAPFRVEGRGPGCRPALPPAARGGVQGRALSRLRPICPAKSPVLARTARPRAAQHGDMAAPCPAHGRCRARGCGYRCPLGDTWAGSKVGPPGEGRPSRRDSSEWIVTLRGFSSTSSPARARS
jgi:hypothetical protein